MLEYQGQPCLHCGKQFEENDDIVVCPECGTPYHRDCYKAAGGCVNQALHESGGSWVLERRAAMQEEKSAEKRAEQEEQAAERARGEKPQMINASLYDGVRLNLNDPCIGLDPNEKLDDATMGEVAEFVATNRLYYLPLFRLMKQTGKRISFNLICVFFPHLYFANRKMWGMTLLSMALNMLMSVPALLYYMNSMQERGLSWLDVTAPGFTQLSAFCNFAAMALSMFWCLFANHLYYRFTLRKIRSIKKVAATETVFHQQLQSAGGTSAANILVTLLIQFCAVLLAVMLITAI